MRKLIRLLAVAGLTASSLMLVGPGVGPAEAQTTGAACVVSASVHTDFLTYLFLDSALPCTGTFHGVAGWAEYLVHATGLTGALTDSLAMENCDGGQNHGLGFLHAHKMAGTEDWPLLILGTVHFLRVGSTVYALGLIHADPDGLLVHWYGEFEFTPNLDDFQLTCINNHTPLINAGLLGVAQISDTVLA